MVDVVVRTFGANYLTCPTHHDDLVASASLPLPDYVLHSSF